MELEGSLPCSQDPFSLTLSIILKQCIFTVNIQYQSTAANSTCPPCCSFLLWSPDFLHASLEAHYMWYTTLSREYVTKYGTWHLENASKHRYFTHYLGMSLVTRLRTGRLGNWGSIPGKGRNLFLLNSFLIVSGVHPASNLVGTGVSFSGYKAAGAWSWPLPSA